jgi:hypothetical protein
MSAAKKASSVSQLKTAKKSAPKAKVTVKAKVKVSAKPKSAKPAPGRSNVLPFKSKKTGAGEPRNIIMELWLAKEEKRKSELKNGKLHETGPPNAYASHHKHDRFARQNAPRRKAT